MVRCVCETTRLILSRSHIVRAFLCLFYLGYTIKKATAAMVAAHKDAARPRRPRAAAPLPLTEAQLDEVRRAVLAMSGTGARSVSRHGIVVYLGKELTLPQPGSRVRPVPISAQEGAPSAATTRPESDTSTSKQRRSRRRLQERTWSSVQLHRCQSGRPNR